MDSAIFYRSVELKMESEQNHNIVGIRIDDLSRPEIATLVEEHLADMRVISPPESTHALPLDGLRRPDVTFLERVGE